MEDQNTFLPLLGPAMPVSRPKQRRSFWSKNRGELDRIGAKGRYAFSSSSSSSSTSNTSTSTSSSETSSSTSTSTTNTDTETSTNSPRCNSNHCICQDILKRSHHTLLSNPDIRTQLFLEVYNWLNGGYHVCASPTTISIPGEEFTPSPSGSAFASVITASGSGSGDGDERGEENKGVLAEQERDEYYATVHPDEYWRDVYGVEGREVGVSEEYASHSNNGRVTMTEQQRDDYYRTVVSAEYWTDVYRAGDREVSGSDKDGSDDGEEEEMKKVKKEEEDTDAEEKKEVKKLQDYSNVLIAAVLGLLVGRSTADPRVLFIILGIFITECLFRFAYLKYKQNRRTKIEKK